MQVSVPLVRLVLAAGSSAVSSTTEETNSRQLRFITTAFNKQLSGNKEPDIKYNSVYSRGELTLPIFFSQMETTQDSSVLQTNSHTDKHRATATLPFGSFISWSVASNVSSSRMTHTNCLILKLSVQKSKFISSNQVKQTAATSHSTQKDAHASKQKLLLMHADFLKPIQQPATRGRLWCDEFTLEELTCGSSYSWWWSV